MTSGSQCNVLSPSLRTLHTNGFRQQLTDLCFDAAIALNERSITRSSLVYSWNGICKRCLMGCIWWIILSVWYLHDAAILILWQITGGSSGIGKAVASEAAKRGAHITLLARNQVDHPKKKWNYLFSSIKRIWSERFNTSCCILKARLTAAKEYVESLLRNKEMQVFYIFPFWLHVFFYFGI